MSVYFFPREIWDPSQSSLPPPHAICLSVCLGLLPHLQPAVHTGRSVDSKSGSKLAVVTRNNIIEDSHA